MPHRDGQGAVWLGQLVPEVVVGGELDGLLGGDEQDVDGAPPVHPEVALGPEGLLEAVQHPGVHPLAIGPRLGVLEPGLDEVQGEHAGDSDDARDTSIDDFRNKRELLWCT